MHLNYLIMSSAVVVLSAQIAVNVSMFASCQMHQVVGGVAMLTHNLSIFMRVAFLNSTYVSFMLHTKLMMALYFHIYYSL